MMHFATNCYLPEIGNEIGKIAKNKLSKQLHPHHESMDRKQRYKILKYYLGIVFRKLLPRDDNVLCHIIQVHRCYIVQILKGS
jgi:hypothetical protein